MTTLERVKQLVRELPVEEREQVVMDILDSLGEEMLPDSDKTFNILDFEGVGAHLYDGSDAQNDINSMRAEWDARP